MIRGLLSAVTCLALAGSPSVASAQACTEYPTPAQAQGLGEVDGIDFGAGSTINRLFVVVATGFLRPWAVDAFALDITITSIDGTDHFHGTDVIPLSDMIVFSIEGEQANLIVIWTEDNEPRVIGDVYTACSQLLLGATPVGPVRCQSFGPF